MSAEQPTSQSQGSETNEQDDHPTDPTEQEATPDEVMPGASEDDLRGEVRRLRDEASEQRVKGKRADTLAARLVEQYAAGTRLLADPSDLRFDAALLDDDGLPDPGKVAAAVDDLIAAKPHLASRTPRGDVDQGARDDDGGVSLAGMLRAGA